jgi:hypothetical protein
MSDLGPVQLIALGFGPQAELEGKAMEELMRLEEHQTVRILDLLFIRHVAETSRYEVLDYHGGDLGAIVGALLGFEFEGAEPPQVPEAPEAQHAFGLAGPEIEEIMSRIEPGYAAAFLLIEHVWARDLKTAIRDAGGVPLGEGFLTPEAIDQVAAELSIISQALDEEPAGAAT